MPCVFFSMNRTLFVVQILLLADLTHFNVIIKGMGQWPFLYMVQVFYHNGFAHREGGEQGGGGAKPPGKNMI